MKKGSKLITKEELMEIKLNAIRDFLYEHTEFEISDIENLRIIGGKC